MKTRSIPEQYFCNPTTGIQPLARSQIFSFNNLYNATAIGFGTIVDDIDKMRFGNSSVLSIGGHVGWTTFSDGRYKRQVAEDVKGIEFIKLLRPVSYTIDLQALDNYYYCNKKNNPDSMGRDASARQQSLQRAATRRGPGFIAQELEKVANKAGFSFSGIDKPSNENALYGLRYAYFVVPLVRAVQEQQILLEELQKKWNCWRKSWEA